jgi:hypothetical protein
MPQLSFRGPCRAGSRRGDVERVSIWIFCTLYALRDYVIQLLLFLAFASWCIATQASYSELGEYQGFLVRASFIGGYVAAGIGFYFLKRELLQCCSCVADEGLKEYVEFWNAA